MTALAVQHCNRALLLIGSSTIDTFDEGTDLATTCASLYPAVVRQLLATYPWRFTLTKARLVALTEAPLSGWARAFAMPTDLIALRALFPSSTGATPTTDFQLFDGRAFTNHTELWLDYQRDAPEEAWPAHFASIIRYALAADFALPVRESAAAADLWHRKAYGPPQDNGQGGMVGWARRLDAQQNPAAGIDRFPLTEARFGS